MVNDTITEEIPEALVGERLDRVVALVAEISRSLAVALIANEGVTVDGQLAASGKVRLRLGQAVAIDQSRIPRELGPKPEPAVHVVVVHEDEAVIVVDKPAGLVVHLGAGHKEGTLVNGLLARFPELAEVGQSHRPGIVHRLDRGTSGLLVVARSPDSYTALVNMMSERRIRRLYTALIWGHTEAQQGIIDAPIGRDPRSPLRMSVVATGREARTGYTERQRFTEPAVSLMTCELETGRTHQIRVHFQAIGHPIVGDATYGGARAGLRMDRPFLHAHRLVFDHPVSGAVMDFESPLPPDLRAVLARCH